MACQPWWQQGCWLTHPASPVVVCVNVFRSHQVCGSAAEPQALIACKGPTVYVARPQCAASCHTMGGNSPTSNCSATPSCGVSMPGCEAGQSLAPPTPTICPLAINLVCVLWGGGEECVTGAVPLCRRWQGLVTIAPRTVCVCVCGIQGWGHTRDVRGHVHAGEVTRASHHMRHMCHAVTPHTCKH